VPIINVCTMSQCAYGPRIGVPRLLELLAHLDVPATFFVPGWVAREHPRMARAIAEAGHEIAPHGWLHEKLPTLTAARERQVLAALWRRSRISRGNAPVATERPGSS
jgi:peptidoglycan-N-acetylglucosamine deacetylase